MQQRLQILVLYVLVIELDDTAIHQKQIQADFHGAPQKYRNIVGIDEVKLQRSHSERIESAVYPLVSIYDAKLRCRQTGQRAGHDVLHLVCQRRFGKLGIIYAVTFVVGHGTVHAALDLLRLKHLLAAALHFPLEPIIHFELVKVEGEGAILKAMRDFQHSIRIFGQIGSIHRKGALKGHDPALTESLIVVSAVNSVLLAHLINNIEDLFSVCIHLSLRKNFIMTYYRVLS